MSDHIGTKSAILGIPSVNLVPPISFIDLVHRRTLIANSLSTILPLLPTKFGFVMAAMDIVARVYPYGHHEGAITRAMQKSSRYVAPLVQSPEPQPARRRGERLPTEEPDNCAVSEQSSKPCIEVKLSDIPRTHHGIVFGTDPDCDMVIPNWKGIGSRHFTMTFDEANRLVVKDWGSLVGTEVTYDGGGRGKRSNFQWIVGGHRRLKEVEEILINLYADACVQFQIVTFYRDVSLPAYVEEVSRFRKGIATAEGLFDDLSIPNRPETERPTGAHTPGTGAIYLKKRVGEGSYGVVDYFWNVSTGEEYAIKKPSEKAHRKGMVNVDAWRHEAFIMDLISRRSHVCVTPVFLL